MTSRRFPNLFIIGAMKAGTSSLHEYLHQHPDIFMSRLKEPQYFAPHTTRWGQDWGQGCSHPEPGDEWYLRLFSAAGAARYAGESSVSYTARPWVGDCEKRIHAFNPDARLIYILRDPIERAISHYWHFVADGREDLSPEAAMRRREEYVSRSDYAFQLQPYLATFDSGQIYVLTLEELRRYPAETLRSLFVWLGVDPDASIATEERHNVSPRYFSQTRRGLVGLDTLLKHWRWKRLARHLPNAVPSWMHQLTHRSLDRESVAIRSAIHSAIRFLRPILQPRTDRLSALLGRSFPEWTTLYAGDLEASDVGAQRLSLEVGR